MKAQFIEMGEILIFLDLFENKRELGQYLIVSSVCDMLNFLMCMSSY